MLPLFLGCYFILAGNDDIHEGLDEFESWPDPCCHFFSDIFYPILFILLGNDDMHESSEECGFLPDPTTDCGVRGRHR